MTEASLEQASRQATLAASSAVDLQALGPAPEVPDYTEVMTRLSLNQLTTPRWSLEQALTRYKQAGLQSIGLNCQKLDDELLASNIERVRQSGLRVTSLGWCEGFTGSLGNSLRDSVLDALRRLKIAKQLKASTLIVVPGPQCNHIRSHATRLVVTAMRELCEAAAGSDLKIALMPMHSMFRNQWSFLHSLDDTLKILDKVGAPSAQLCFGTYHMWPEPGLLERLPEIASRIALVQLSDWREAPRSENDRLIPGQGNLPISELVTGLEQAGYQGAYEIEVWSRELWQQDHTELVQTCINNSRNLLHSAFLKAAAATDQTHTS